MNRSRAWIPALLLLIVVIVVGVHFLIFRLRAPGEAVSPAPQAQTFPLADKSRRVFILHSYHHGYLWTDNLQAGIEEAFRRSGLNVETTCFHMDAKRVIPTEAYLDSIRAHLREATRGLSFAAVLACDNDAFDFLVRARDELFPGVPLVFTGINDFSPERLRGRNDLTGTGENTEYKKTLELALTLRPKARRAVIVTDGTTTGRAHRHAVSRDLAAFTNRLTFEHLSLADCTMEEALERLSRLDEGAFVLLLQQFKDRAGRNFSMAEGTSLIARRSPVPCFVVNDSRMGFGVVGGHVVSGLEHGKAGAERVLAILRGTPPSKIPYSTDVPERDLFDARALARFEISESALPKGSLVMNREENLLARYRTEFLTAGVFVALALVFMAFMALEILRRHRTEEALRESETKLRAILRHSRDAIGLSRAQRHTFVNPAYVALFGYEDEAALIDRPILELIAPAARERIAEFAARRAAGQGVPPLYETRGLRRDGTEFDMEVSATTVALRYGEHTLVTMRDIT